MATREVQLVDTVRARSEGTVLGIPLGDLGGFQTVLMSLASGFAAFFAGTFVTILVLLGMTIADGGRKPDFAISYRYVGLPLGMLVLLVVGSVLGTLWVRRKLRPR